MDAIDRRLLNDFQRGFPLAPRPFASIAGVLGTTEEVVIERLRELCARGVVSRVGPVFRPHALGASTLAAMAVPVDRLTEVAALVSSYPEVNHNYEREHRLNLWFVLTAGTNQELTAVIEDIQHRTERRVFPLPMLEDYHIDLGFRMQLGAEEVPAEVTEGNAAPAWNEPQSSLAIPAVRLQDLQKQRLIAAIQRGIPVSSRPFAAVGQRVGISERQVIQGLATLLRLKLIKRFGVVVRHHELGYRANAMVVWDVADPWVGSVGRRVATMDFVTLCYRRARYFPTWPYNLYCMIHGCDRDTVRAQLESLIQRCDLRHLRHEVLFSRRRFKQRGALYQHSPIKGAGVAAA